jgi:hypothetical protein
MVEDAVTTARRTVPTKVLLAISNARKSLANRAPRLPQIRAEKFND